MPNPMHPIVGPEDYLSPYTDTSYSKGPKIIYGDIDVFTVVLNDAQTDDDDEWGRTEQIALRMVIDEAVAVHKELFGWSSILGLKDKFKALSDRFVGFGPNFTEYSAKTSVLTLGESGETMLQGGLLTVGSGAFLSSDNVGLSLSNGSFTVETNPLTLATTIEAANISNTTSIVLGPSNTGNSIILDVNGAPYTFTETTLTLPGALLAVDFIVTNVTANVASINNLTSPSITIQILMGEPAVPMGVNLAAGSVDIDGFVSRYGLVLTKVGGADGLILDEMGLYINGHNITAPRIDITYEGIRFFGYDHSETPRLNVTSESITLLNSTDNDLFAVNNNGLTFYNVDGAILFGVDDTGVRSLLKVAIINTVEGDPDPVLVNFNLAANREDYNGGDYFYGLVLTSSDGAKNLILKEVALILLGESYTDQQVRITNQGISFYNYENANTPLLTLGSGGIHLKTATESSLFDVAETDFSYYNMDDFKIFNVNDETGLNIRITGNGNELIASPLGIKIRSILYSDDVIRFQVTNTSIDLRGTSGVYSIFNTSAGFLQVSTDSGEDSVAVITADIHGISTGHNSLKWRTFDIYPVAWPGNDVSFPYAIPEGPFVLDDSDDPIIMSNVKNVVVDLYDSDNISVYSGYGYSQIFTIEGSTEVSLGAFTFISDHPGTSTVRVRVTIFYTA